MESVSDIDVKLFDSSLRGDLEGVVDALAQGGRVAMRNYQGLSPLLISAQNGHTDICGLLLAHGSDVNEMDLKSKHSVRVAKCHGYGRYICVKNSKIGVKSLGKHTNLQKKIFLGGKFEQLI